jgi:molybdopterin/thiamine biosynthesis adenylyltransferase
MNNLLPHNRIFRPQLPPNCAVKLIGLGGVGSVVARYGAVFLASLGQEVRFVLVDGDVFEYSNASRMLFAGYGNKAAVLRSELLPRFADSSLSLLAVEKFATPDNVSSLIQSGDLCLLCVDNHATRKLLSGHCSQLADVCLISGGNDGVGKDSSGAVRRGTYGNVQIYARCHGKDVTPSLASNHPEIASPADHLPGDQNCTELVASTPQILFANLAVASAMLNTLFLWLSGALHYGELSFDIADGLMRPTMPLSKTCGRGPHRLIARKSGSRRLAGNRTQPPEL